MRNALIIACFFLATAGFGQQAKQYAFKHFSVINGLASNSVDDVIQDADGYMWVATANGLQRYDGNSFLTFKGHEKIAGSLPDVSINRLYLDRKNRLWLSGDNNHVGIFDTKKFTYKKAGLAKDDAKSFSGQHFVTLQSGELLLIKHSRQVLKYDEQRNEFINTETALPYPKNWHPNEILWDASIKKYWVSCDSGLVLIDPANRHVSYGGHNTDQDPVIAAFATQRGTSGVRVDGAGNVFFIYWKVTEPWPVIFRYNRKTQTAESHSLLNELKGYHEIMDFLVQRNGRVWVYGMPFFAEWQRQSSSFILLSNGSQIEQGLNFDHINHAVEDRENNIWMATDNGVFLFNPEEQIFTTYNLIRPGGNMVQAAVQALAETKDRKIFVGCWGAGLFCFDQQFNPVPVPRAFGPKYSDMSIWDMTVHSRSGYLWIGEQGGILDIYDPRTERLKMLRPAIFQNSTIRQIDEDTSGNLWFGTQNGRLIKWDYQKSGGDPEKGYELVYETGRILKVHFDYQGYIWVGALGHGLLKIDARTNKLVKTFSKDGKEGERLYMDAPGDMTYYNDSTLLVTAGCLNIINTKTNQVRFISAEDGLPSNTTESFQRDKNGIVWIGMTNGICRLNLDKKMISYYDRKDGIVYDRFNTTGVEQLSDGRMVFYTAHNFLAFDPKKIAGQMVPPQPFITSFRLGEELLSLDSLQRSRNVVLQYDNTSISIDFSALSYLNQRKIHYFYKLEGLDKDWIHTDHPIEAIYNYLPPGDYTFKVKSENVDGITSHEIASIPIVVRPPFWQTWWFYSLMALMVIAILYLLDRERMKRRRSLQQVRSQIRANLRDEVSTTLNNINVLSEIAKIKADKNVEQAKEFIDQISEKSRNMNEALDDTLWGIDPSNDSMKKFVFRIKELTEGLQLDYNTGIDLIVDHKVQGMELDMKLRHELFFFYKEALHFILQNLRSTQVFVNFNKVRSNLAIELLCECRNVEDFSQVFRNTVQKRMEALSATMDVMADARSFAVVVYVNVK
jgi:ligand-binding sensor domain-containing protein